MQQLKNIPIAISGDNLIRDCRGSYHSVNLYLAYYQTIPNRIWLNNIDCKAYRKWFEAEHADQIIDHKALWYPLDKHEPKAQKDDLYYFLKGEIILYLDTNQHKVQLLFPDEHHPLLKALHEASTKFKMNDEQKLYLSQISRSPSGFDLERMEIRRRAGHLEDHYNDDFLPIHQEILKRLNTDLDKGIVLLHGKPGTGKTSYIRHLISEVKKEVIFLPPAMAGALTDPGLISILTENPNSIFVIEDAENILVARDASRNSPVSTLLNISDGLLADCLNVQIICTFNTDLANIDQALLRKGRLIARYDFKELTVTKAKRLAEKIGYPHPINKPMALNELYHAQDLEFKEEEKKAIGF